MELRSLQFVAIDFETANNRSDSACQLALVIVEGGAIVQEKAWLIRPKRMYFSPQCIAVHGILPEHVENQPRWDAIWGEVQSMLDGRTIIAHNAGFDIRVMASTSASYDLVCPNLEYTCTRLIARRTWPGRTGYGLKPTAESLGLSFRHHDALEDARVCAKIALAAAKQVEAYSLEQLEARLSIMRGRYRFGTMTGPRCIKRSRSKSMEEMPGPTTRRYHRDGWPDTPRSNNPLRTKQRLAAVDSMVASQGDQQPLANKSVVLSGSLMGLEHADAVSFLERLGAKVQSGINLETDFLILGHGVGSGSSLSTAEGAFARSTMNDNSEAVSPRQAEAQRRREQGQPIRVLTQRQLLAIIPGGLATARALAEG